MGLFRKKNAESKPDPGAPTVLTEVATSSDVVAQQRRPFTAAELAPLVARSARSWGSDARIYLIVSDALRSDGYADEWEFHVLFPTLRAEGTWKLGPSEDGASSILSTKVSPVPEPGTTEFLMAQISPQLRIDVNEAWDLRLRLIAPLPDAFVDSPSVAAAIERAEPMAFAFGPIRLKARTLPTGDPVWEWASNDVLHVPFGLTNDAESPVTSPA
jgi:hypothetical protein